MYKHLLFIALVALATANFSLNKDGKDCTEEKCKDQLKNCDADEGCRKTMDSCPEPKGEKPTQEELDCVKKNGKAWELVQCILAKCPPPPPKKQMNMHHQRSKLSKQSQRLTA